MYERRSRLVLHAISPTRAHATSHLDSLHACMAQSERRNPSSLQAGTQLRQVTLMTEAHWRSMPLYASLHRLATTVAAARPPVIPKGVRARPDAAPRALCVATRARAVARSNMGGRLSRPRAPVYQPPMPLPYEPPPPSPTATLLVLAGLSCCVALAASSRTVEVPPKFLQVFGLVVSIASVAVPGRFDDEADVLFSSPWPTLFSPAGYAFAIWALIYLGELLGVLALVVASESDAEYAQSARAWLCANLAQALWCVTFRPWSLCQLWLPSLCEWHSPACGTEHFAPPLLL